MSSYSDLEDREGLRDIVSAKVYGDKAHRMEIVFDELLRQRPRTVGLDLMPGVDESKLWATVLCAYSLLEQCLKLLVGIRTPRYLPPNWGRDTAFRDGHNLAKIYDRLTDMDRRILEDAYAEYASFVEFPSSFSSLKTYLNEVGDGQVAWRYFLLEKDVATMGKLPSPLSPDMLLEITRATLGILMAKSWADHGPHGVHRRLQHSLGDALAHPSPLGVLTSDDLNHWIRDGGGIVNAFARYLRAAPLDDYSDAMTNWLDQSVRAARDLAKGNKDADLGPVDTMGGIVGWV